MNQNSQPPKYRYADEIPGGHVPIQIIDGKYQGIVVRYDKVILEERNENLYFDYDYDVLKNPDDIEITDELRDIFTSFLVSVMDEQITNMPDDFDLLKEGDSEEHRESNTTEPPIQ